MSNVAFVFIIMFAGLLFSVPIGISLGTATVLAILCYSTTPSYIVIQNIFGGLNCFPGRISWNAVQQKKRNIAVFLLQAPDCLFKVSAGADYNFRPVFNGCQNGIFTCIRCVGIDIVAGIRYSRPHGISLQALKSCLIETVIYTGADVSDKSHRHAGTIIILMVLCRFLL